jgi:hypothetical protein
MRYFNFFFSKGCGLMDTCISLVKFTEYVLFSFQILYFLIPNFSPGEDVQILKNKPPYTLSKP